VAIIPPSSLGQPTDQDALVAVLLEVREHQRHRLAHEAATVDRQPVRAPQHQSRVLDLEQLVGGDVDRHLLVVPHAPARLARPALVLGRHAADRLDRGDRRRLVGHGPDRGLLAPGLAEQVVGGGKTHPSRHRTTTSLASER
jgi:hypothetical protein